MKTKVTIGIDIGGTNTVIGFVDFSGEVIFKKIITTLNNNTPEEFAELLAEQILEISSTRLNQYEMASIGIAAPCGNHFTGMIENPSNFNWGVVNFIALLEKHFNIPIVLLNDANSAAMGELMFGKAKGMKNFIVYTLGTGIGSGIVLNGEIFYGNNGLAGELGHISVKTNGRMCKCGKSGCLETYISSNGLKRTAFKLMSYYNIPSKLREESFSNLSAKKIFELANVKDELALKVFEHATNMLGRALADAVANFEPEAIILSGGLLNAGDLIMNYTQKSFNDNLLYMYKNKVKLLKSDMHNGEAAVLGAAVMAKNLLENKKEVEI